MPYKKMNKVDKFGFIARCDCGHEHKLNSDDIDLMKTDMSKVIFKDIYTCPQCHTLYDGVLDKQISKDEGLRKIKPLGVLISVVLSRLNGQ